MGQCFIKTAFLRILKGISNKKQLGLQKPKHIK